jgi:hypothetical protein
LGKLKTRLERPCLVRRKEEEGEYVRGALTYLHCSRIEISVRCPFKLLGCWILFAEARSLVVYVEDLVERLKECFSRRLKK